VLVPDTLKSEQIVERLRVLGGFMNGHTYKQIELTGSSKTSIEDAVQSAIAKASKTLHDLRWFQIVESRGYIENGRVDYWQVTIKLGFRLDE
jgi:dodecin